jgi:DNA gyrase subunit A
MPEHWRLGVVERSVLEALDQLGARPDGHHVKCAKTVRQLERELGVNPRFGYQSLCALAQPWLQNVPLVDFHGNWGSTSDPPAAPRYTEARLSPAGLLALDAERGAGPKVPVVLINGNLGVDGTAPPYSPTRVISTLLALLDVRAIGDDEIVERIGMPESPTGCVMGCDDRALASGESIGLVMSARITREEVERGPVIVLSGLPLGIGSYAVESVMAQRVAEHRYRDGHPESADLYDLGLPLRDVRDESDSSRDRIVCEPRKNVDIEQCAEQIAATWGVTIRTEVQLPAPLPVLVRELADEDPARLRTALASLSGG